METKGIMTLPIYHELGKGYHGYRLCSENEDWQIFRTWSLLEDNSFFYIILKAKRLTQLNGQV